jgi:hypothetical protein
MGDDGEWSERVYNISKKSGTRNSNPLVIIRIPQQTTEYFILYFLDTNRTNLAAEENVEKSDVIKPSQHKRHPIYTKKYQNVQEKYSGNI